MESSRRRKPKYPRRGRGKERATGGWKLYKKKQEQKPIKQYHAILLEEIMEAFGVLSNNMLK